MSHISGNDVRGKKEQKKETEIRQDKQETGNYETIKRTLVSWELENRSMN
jgi:hypothetical protein